MVTILRSALETTKFGQKFAKKLKSGAVIGLIGDLGTGKTTFIKGLAEGLGIKETITSPTFVVLREYNILQPKPHLAGAENRFKKFVHIDTYRTQNIKDIKSVGIDDYLNRKDTIIVVEWAQKIREILPKNTIYINFKHLSENEREISIIK